MHVYEYFKKYSKFMWKCEEPKVGTPILKTKKILVGQMA